MRYKLLKDLPDIKAGEYEYDLHSIRGSQLIKGNFKYCIPFTRLANKEWFEEIKEVTSIYDKYEQYRNEMENEGHSNDGVPFWYIDKRGEVKAECFSLEELFHQGNAFLTKEEAETELQKRKAMATIKKRSHHNDGGYEMKWGEMSYYVFLDGFIDKQGAEFNIQETYVGETLGEHYYSSEEIAEQALKELEPEYKILFNIK